MLKVNVLSSEEFDNLPFEITKGSDISDSLGFADPKTNQAYVRQGNVHELTKYLINHEVEELLTDSSAHEDENGIRHKKFLGLFGGKPKTPSFPQRIVQQVPIISQPEIPTGGMGGVLGQFSTQESATPTGAGVNSVVGRLGGGLVRGPSVAGINISESLRQRIKGFFAGRTAF